MSNFNKEVREIIEEAILSPRTKNFISNAGKALAGGAAIAAGLNPFEIHKTYKNVKHELNRNYEIYLDSRDKDVIAAGIRLTQPRTLRSNDFNNFLPHYGSFTLYKFLESLSVQPKVDTTEDTDDDSVKAPITITPEVTKFYEEILKMKKARVKLDHHKIASLLTTCGIHGKTEREIKTLTMFIEKKLEKGTLSEAELQRKVFPATSGIGGVSVREMTVIFDIVLRITAGKPYSDLKNRMTLSTFVHNYYRPFIIKKARRHAPAYTNYFNQ